MIHLIVIGLGTFAVCSMIGHKFFQSLGWQVFRYFHRNSPDALAFAEREQNR